MGKVGGAALSWAVGAFALFHCGGQSFIVSEAGASGAASSGASSGSARSGTDSGPQASGTIGEGGASSGTVAGSGSGSGADAGGEVALCPSGAPMAGSQCPRTGLDCEYGTSPNVICNQLAECQASGWGYVATQPCPPSMCPATYEAIPNGASCKDKGDICAYPRGTCNCSPPAGPVLLVDGGTSVWDCYPATAACQSPRPNIGTPCLDEGQTCNYGACTGGIALVCRQGRWQQTAEPCPL
jgi:hypothetical protein